MTNVAPLRRTLSDLQAYAPEVASQLRTAEQAVDHAIDQIALLTSKMIEVRLNSKLAATLSHDAISPVGEAMEALIRGRGKVVDVHNALAATGNKLRLDPKSYGGLDHKG